MNINIYKRTERRWIEIDEQDIHILPCSECSSPSSYTVNKGSDSRPALHPYCTDCSNDAEFQMFCETKDAARFEEMAYGRDN